MNDPEASRPALQVPDGPEQWYVLRDGKQEAQRLVKMKPLLMERCNHDLHSQWVHEYPQTPEHQAVHGILHWKWYPVELDSPGA